jgi:hypothetical protein
LEQREPQDVHHVAETLLHQSVTTV